jgi:hypothetical protein
MTPHQKILQQNVHTTEDKAMANLLADDGIPEFTILAVEGPWGKSCILLPITHLVVSFASLITLLLKPPSVCLSIRL